MMSEHTDVEALADTIIETIKSALRSYTREQLEPLRARVEKLERGATAPDESTIPEFTR
jgi:hypothetical protein